MEFELTMIINDGMACIPTSLEANADIGLVAQMIDDFSFTLITPLGANNDGY
jgi:hypothetical protein